MYRDFTHDAAMGGKVKSGGGEDDRSLGSKGKGGAGGSKGGTTGAGDSRGGRPPGRGPELNAQTQQQHPNQQQLPQRGKTSPELKNYGQIYSHNQPHLKWPNAAFFEELVEEFQGRRETASKKEDASINASTNYDDDNDDGVIDAETTTTMTTTMTTKIIGDASARAVNFSGRFLRFRKRVFNICRKLNEERAEDTNAGEDVAAANWHWRHREAAAALARLATNEIADSTDNAAAAESIAVAALSALPSFSEECAQENVQQFLLHFHKFIAGKLTDRSSPLNDNLNDNNDGGGEKKKKARNATKKARASFIMTNATKMLTKCKHMISI